MNIEENQELIKKIVSVIEVPVLVSGSAVMVMNGIEREIDDLDLFCSTRDWFDLRPYKRLVTPDKDCPISCNDPAYLSAILHGVETNIFCQWRVRDEGNINIALEWRHSETIDGISCIALDRLMQWKAELRRKKDIPDIAAIAGKLSTS